jgi:glutamate racemase
VSPERDQAIGVFDSGIGGLTVVRALFGALPHERIVYFGDTARVPYGSKSKETVTRFSIQNVQFLLEQKVKLVVVACNTASALSLAELEQRFQVPIIGVISPGAQAAGEATKNDRIGVIGTRATIASGAYERAIREAKPRALVYGQACPLFVPLAEEGWHEGAVAEMVAGEYLRPLVESGVDCLLLGCTHYPLLAGVIRKVMGDGVTLVDSATATALFTKRLLEERGLVHPGTEEPRHAFFVSDRPLKFSEVAERFLGEPLATCLTVSVDGL